MRKLQNLLFIALTIFVFGKSNAQKIIHDAEYYIIEAQNGKKWAVEDGELNKKLAELKKKYKTPLNPTVVQAEQVDTSADGTAVKGAAVGAAGGAAVGAIAGDAGKGAAIGATVGGVRGIRAKKGGDAQQQQANDQAAAATSTALADDYKKAYSVCMEGKGYTVK